jgi:hypothetical protein
MILLCLLAFLLIASTIPRVLPIVRAQVMPILRSQGGSEQRSVRATIVCYPERDPTVRELGRTQHAIDTFRNTQMALIKSDSVLREVVSRPNIEGLTVIKQSGDPVEWVSRRLRVEPEANLIHISLNGGSPRHQQVIVNAVLATYMELHVNKERFRKMEVQDRVLQEYQSYTKKLAQARSELRSLKRAAGISADSRAWDEASMQSALGHWSRSRDEITTRLREARLAKVVAQDRLQRGEALHARSDEAAEAQRQQRETLADEIAVLDAQERFLQKEHAELVGARERLLNEAQRTPQESGELEQRSDEIEQLESATRKLADILVGMQIDQVSPPTIALLSQATSGARN